MIHVAKKNETNYIINRTWNKISKGPQGEKYQSWVYFHTFGATYKMTDDEIINLFENKKK